MLVDFIPYINGQLADNKIVQLPNIPDNLAYDNAHNFYNDAAYVEQKLDGNGWITMMVPGNHGIIRYRQETHQ